MVAYPLSHPTSPGFRSLKARPFSVVAVAVSPFSLSQQAYVWPGQAWAFDLELPPMRRPAAEAWIAWLLSLNGREGTFLLGDPDATVPRGTWAAATVNGAGQTGGQLIVDGMGAGATALAGDYLMLGSGSSARLHKVLADVVANGSGQATLTIWPKLRSSPADNAPLTLANAKGVFRLTSNEMPWSTDQASLYGLSFAAVEAL